LLKERDDPLDALPVTGSERGPQGIQVGADGERSLGLPDDQPLVAFLRDVESAVESLENVGTDRVRLGLEGDDQDVISARECAYAGILVHRVAERRPARP